MEEEVEERGILGEIQFGFRKGRSTGDAAFILRQIFDQGKRKKNVKVTFLDVRKAYDRVALPRIRTRPEQDNEWSCELATARNLGAHAVTQWHLHRSATIIRDGHPLKDYTT